MVEPDFSVTGGYFDINDTPSIPGVYALVSRRTGEPIYVGKTGNIKRRIYEHLHNTNGHAELRYWLATIDAGLLAVVVYDLPSCERISALAGDAALRCVESEIAYKARPHFNKRVLSKYMGEGGRAVTLTDRRVDRLHVYVDGQAYHYAAIDIFGSIADRQ